MHRKAWSRQLLTSVNEERHLTNKAKKPWLKLGMSRRTWYRRQAEQRKGRE
jgi:hypothetical protein